MDNLNKKISEMFGKMDEKVMKIKINEALNMMKNGKQEDLAKMLDKTDKKDILEKLKDLDQKAINNLNININEVKKNISDDDYKKFKNATDADGKAIADKIKSILDKS